MVRLSAGVSGGNDIARCWLDGWWLEISYSPEPRDNGWVGSCLCTPSHAELLKCLQGLGPH